MPGGASLEADCTARHVRRWQSMFAQARAGVLGHLPPGLTHELLDWCSRLGTFAALVPGLNQFADLAGYRPDLLVLNLAEAAKATGAGPAESPAHVFLGLLQLTPAPLVAMTGGGEHPIIFADRGRGIRGTAGPAALDRIQTPAEAFPRGVGAGDVFSCVLTRCLSLGQAIEYAVGWARLYATAHVSGRCFATRVQAEGWRAGNRDAFPPIDTSTLPRLAA